MVDFSIKLQQSRRDIFPLAKLVKDEIVAKILRQSITEILKKYRTQVRRSLAGRMQVPVSLINPRVKVGNLVVRDFKAGKMRASIWVGTYRIPVIKTLRSGTVLRAGAGGVVAGTKRKDKLSIGRGSFIATMPNKKTGVFVRNPNSPSSSGRDRKGRVRKNRLGIQELKIDIHQAAEQLMIELVQKTDFLNDVDARFERKLRQYANG